MIFAEEEEELEARLLFLWLFVTPESTANDETPTLYRRDIIIRYFFVVIVAASSIANSLLDALWAVGFKRSLSIR
jgi:hypothetical protein